MQNDTKYKNLDMPLSVWIDAIVDGDTSKIENYTDVYMEFCQLIGGKELEQRLETLKDIHALQSKIKIAEMCINMLMAKPDKVIYDALLTLEYHTSVTEYDENRVQEGIEQMKPYINLDVVDLQVLLNRVKSGEGGSYTREYFATMLVDMGIAFKMNIPDTISVRTYCVYVVRYKQHIEHLKRQNEQL